MTVFEDLSMDDRTWNAVEWLCRSDEPAIRFLVRRDILGEEARGEEERILEGPKVCTLLAGQKGDGGFGVHPYQKWTGAHWRLVSLVELAVPKGEPRAVRAADTVVAWLTSEARRSTIRPVDGRRPPRRRRTATRSQRAAGSGSPTIRGSASSRSRSSSGSGRMAAGIATGG